MGGQWGLTCWSIRLVSCQGTCVPACTELYDQRGIVGGGGADGVVLDTWKAVGVFVYIIICIC